MRAFAKYVNQKKDTIIVYGDIEQIKLGNFWEEIAPLSDIGLYGAVSFSIDNIGYVGLGSNENGMKNTSFWTYSSKDGWKELAKTYPTGLENSTSFVIGNKAYVGLGVQSFLTFDEIFYGFDQETGTWPTEIFSFEFGPRQDAVAFSIGDYGYVGTGRMCGKTSGRPENLDCDCDRHLCFQNDFLKLNPNLGEEWISINTPNNIANRRGAIGFSIAEKGYVGFGLVGGTKESISNATLTRPQDLWSYSPDADAGWVRVIVPSGLSGRENAIGLSDEKGYGYIIGGGQSDPIKTDLDYNEVSEEGTPIQKDIWRFTPNGDWDRLADMPFARWQGVGFVIDGIIYVGLGEILNGGKREIDNRFYRFIPPEEE